jgi:hypothetical protein
MADDFLAGGLQKSERRRGSVARRREWSRSFFLFWGRRGRELRCASLYCRNISVNLVPSFHQERGSPVTAVTVMRVPRHCFSIFVNLVC